MALMDLRTASDGSKGFAGGAAETPAGEAPAVGDGELDVVNQLRRIILALVVRITLNAVADESADQVVDRLTKEACP